MILQSLFSASDPRELGDCCPLGEASRVEPYWHQRQASRRHRRLFRETVHSPPVLAFVFDYRCSVWSTWRWKICLANGWPYTSTRRRHGLAEILEITQCPDCQLLSFKLRGLRPAPWRVNPGTCTSSPSRASARVGSNTSIGFPEGSSAMICLPPMPVTMSILNRTPRSCAASLPCQRCPHFDREAMPAASRIRRAQYKTQIATADHRKSWSGMHDFLEPKETTIERNCSSTL